MSVQVKGAKEIGRALQEVSENLKDGEMITSQLSRLMKDYIHVDTGYLRSTIYQRQWEAGASAPYAGYEEQRGGSHAYATQAMNRFDMESYADDIVEPY